MDHGDPSDAVLYHWLGRTPETVPDDEKRQGLQFLLSDDSADDEYDEDMMETST